MMAAVSSTPASSTAAPRLKVMCLQWQQAVCAALGLAAAAALMDVNICGAVERK